MATVHTAFLSIPEMIEGVLEGAEGYKNMTMPYIRYVGTLGSNIFRSLEQDGRKTTQLNLCICTKKFLCFYTFYFKFNFFKSISLPKDVY